MGGENRTRWPLESRGATAWAERPPGLAHMPLTVVPMSAAACCDIGTAEMNWTCWYQRIEAILLIRSFLEGGNERCAGALEVGGQRVLAHMPGEREVEPVHAEVGVTRRGCRVDLVWRRDRDLQRAEVIAPCHLVVGRLERGDVPGGACEAEPPSVPSVGVPDGPADDGARVAADDDRRVRPLHRARGCPNALGGGHGPPLTRPRLRPHHPRARPP